MKIKSVTTKTNHRGSWWLVLTDQPTDPKLTTTDMFVAALAERAMETGADVKVLTRSGWFYREISHLSICEDPHIGGC